MGLICQSKQGIHSTNMRRYLHYNVWCQMVHKSHSGIIRFKMRKISLNFFVSTISTMCHYIFLRWDEIVTPEVISPDAMLLTLQCSYSMGFSFSIKLTCIAVYF